MIFWDLRLLPLASAFLSIFLCALNATIHAILDGRPVTSNPDLKTSIGVRAREGGYSILGLNVARFIGILTLVYLAAKTPIQDNTPFKHAHTTVFLYSAVLQLTSLWVRGSTVHNNIILLVAFGVYAYRDLWPLATYDQEPADVSEGNLLWVKLAILFMVAIIIPLFIPRRFEPVEVATIPNPEQTSSWISKLTYTYVDPVIAAAYKVPHLPAERLPPLADTDHGKYQCNTAFPYIDTYTGAKRRHLFWGLLYHFRREYLILSACLIATGITSFAGPLAIKQLLGYMETGGQNSTVKPWFWIGLLLLGPLLNSIFQHWNSYLQNVILVRVQAVLTQLVFNHSLRIRLKAEVSTGPSAPSSTEIPAVSEGADVPNEGTQSPKSRERSAENLIGKITNLVTNDISNVGQGDDFVSLFFFMPLQIGLSIIFLNKVLGWSALVGLFTLIALSPIPGWIAKRNQDVEKVKMQKTDARVQIISEIISVIRMVKLFGWEEKTSKKINEKREEELKYLLRMKIFRLLIHSMSDFIPTLAMLFTYATYTVVMKETLTASKIFSSMAVFVIMRNQLGSISYKLNSFISAKVSLDRLTQFLHDTEVLDRYAAAGQDLVPSDSAADQDEQADSRIGFRKATFAWSKPDTDGTLTPSRNFRLQIDEELLFKRGCINMIVGPTGSGKTSILMALLGEMHFMPSGPDSWYNLPREGGVAYAAQESWVQSTTIRENILFGSPYDEARYRSVIHQCALERDLELFEAGDQTEVGERGLTLSGGQKARVTLARAVYSSAQTILMDDVLAALDVHTAAWIVKKCLRGDLVTGRTVLIVTHNLALIGPIAHFVASMGLDGTIKNQGAIEGTYGPYDNSTLALAQKKQDTALEVGKEIEDEHQAKPHTGGKLVVAEEIVEGRVGWKSINLLISGLGGRHPILFFTLLILGLIGSRLTYIAQTWFLGIWGSQYEHHSPSDVHLSYYLGMFASIVFAGEIFDTTVNVIFFTRTVVAARIIHSKLLDSVFRSTFRWLDETPTSRVIARCTQDIRTIDGPISHSMCFALDQFLEVAIRFGVIVLVTPFFVIPGCVVGFLGALVGVLYLKAQLSMKREMSNSRSPVLAHVSASLHGLVSVRAYGSQDAFKEELIKRIDHYSRISRMSGDLNRWVGLRTDYLGAIFTALLASYQVYVQDASASNTGFSLNMAVSFCISIFWSIQLFNEFEVESNSLERIQGYLEIEHEPKPTESGKLPAHWPSTGDLVVSNLSARYSQSGPKVLHNLSFQVRSGERVGIVGRTGSGKSSLSLALLRCIITEGTVRLDGIPTDQINLDALRSSMTIIPQVPELMSGTLRENLDPFQQHEDVALNDALKSAGLFSLQGDVGENHLGLDSLISGGGSNLSVGQRQIIALARAMMRGSKFLIFDEATSAIDYETDAVIQNTLRTRLGPNVTVLTIAHRLQTVMDADKIMVLDNGKIIEFDNPTSLLHKETSAFRALVNESGNRGL